MKKLALKFISLAIISSAFYSCDEETTEALIGEDSEACKALESLTLSEASISYVSGNKAIVEIKAEFSEEESLGALKKYEWFIDGVPAMEFLGSKDALNQDFSLGNSFKYQFAENGTFEVCSKVVNACKDSTADKCTTVVVEMPEEFVPQPPVDTACDNSKLEFELVTAGNIPAEQTIKKIDESTYSIEFVESSATNQVTVIPPLELVNNDWKWTLDGEKYLDPDFGLFFAKGFGFGFEAQSIEDHPVGIGSHKLCFEVESPNCETAITKCITLIIKDEFPSDELEK